MLQQIAKEVVSNVPLRQISVVIITQNEQARVTKAIRSCLGFADEVVVVDGGSEDSTVECAQDLGCKVYINPWPGYAKQRNFGAEKATSDWIFFIDSDEIVSEELASSLVTWKNAPLLEADAFAVDRVGDFLGKWLDGFVEKHVRLYNKNVIRIKDVLVHEGPDIGNARVINLPGILWHHGFRSIDDHVTRFNKATNLEAQQAYLEGKKFSLARLLLKPPARFCQKYILQGMYKQGIAGFTVAILWVYYDLIKEIKIYEVYWQKNS